MNKKFFIILVMSLILLFTNIKPEAMDKTPGKTVISISAVGDCTIGSFPEVTAGKSFFDVYKKYDCDYGYFFKNAPVLKADDLSIINLEGTFTASTDRAKKKWTFKAPPEFVKVLNKASIEAAAISNNHIFDYGTKGMQETVKTLKTNSIEPAGENNHPVLIVKSKKIALLSYNMLSRSEQTVNTMKKDIVNASKETDFIIVCFHWGTEYTYMPDEFCRKTAKLAINLGADLILGTHPHILQGIEEYRDRYIVYSLGNFVFGGNDILNDEKHKDHDTMLFTQNFVIDNAKLVPQKCKIAFYRQSGDKSFNDYCPVRLSKIEASAVRDKVLSISKKLEYGVKNIELR